jgi:hypothetical protein
MPTRDEGEQVRATADLTRSRYAAHEMHKYCRSVRATR